MAAPDTPALKTIRHLASVTPASDARAWQTAAHPSLPLVATACSDKTVRVSSLTSFTLLSTITGGHKRSVRCCAWKPTLTKNSRNGNDTTLVTGSFDATAAIWVGQPEGYKGGDVDSDDDLSGSDDEDGYRFAVLLEGHDSEIKSIAWSIHGTFLATCSRDKSVWIWEALDGDSLEYVSAGDVDDDDNYETVAVMQEHDGDVKSVAWHPTEERCLASGSYDETIRVWREDISDGEWTCVGICEGHDGTVWSIGWEPANASNKDSDNSHETNGVDKQDSSGPRIISSSDDLTIRVWRRKPKVKPQLPTGPKIPSILRNADNDEEWLEETQLPQEHDRSIYSVHWSPISRRVVSCGGDGQIVVYEETAKKEEHCDIHMANGDGSQHGYQDPAYPISNSQWVVVGKVQGAHGVFEVNHVCWAKRFDREKRHEDDEVIISTGDDGEIKFWVLEEP